MAELGDVSVEMELDGLDDGFGGPVRFGDYELRELLGRGGMGEVVLAHDEWIGREVALKRMRRTAPDIEAERRFLREAKIQARLQHPAIVPVHQLGRDADGRPYFTMKRLAGVTLQELLGGPPQRLLRAFAEVCLAIEFAHEHGVIHRDLKPTNIMLGDFGEVYVLDWGVALVVGDGSASPSIQDIAATAGETQVGAVMGTPGYMAPEQALGYSMTPALDVYALGCVLFEILTGEPLHPRGAGGAANAIANPTEAPSARRPERAIAPELDAACTAALAEDPAARPTARALAQRIQDYLDGDRDLERRRELAAAQLADAKAQLASGDPDRRAGAVHAAGRALALDPASIEAADLLAALIVEPPRVLPPALVQSLDDTDRAATQLRARMSMIAFASIVPFIAVAPFVHVVSWPLLLGFFGSMAGMAVVSWLSYRRGLQIGWISLVSTLVTTLLASRLGGPFVLTPVITCGIAIGLSSFPRLAARPALLLAWIAVAVVAPVVLEVAGVFQRTWWYDGDTMRIQSAVLHGINRPLETVVMLLAHIALIAMAGNVVRTTGRERRAAERRLHIQAWHLRQLLPNRAPAA
ncbi:MAG TPA: serine/threonine-protein kinase [Kofleriaceae bacterium]|jgi:serine/threonine-protein kinase|nr:serine/threonine-protein kinase [Kofleriaceae bacterium]